MRLFVCVCVNVTAPNAVQLHFRAIAMQCMHVNVHVQSQALEEAPKIFGGM